MDADPDAAIVPDGNLEVLAAAAADSLSKFPDEIWTIIFDNIKGSSRDLLSCSRVCKNWERILKSDETTWLFDEVFPHLFLYLNKRDILNVRQVGKRWKTVVDNFVENHPSRRPFNVERSEIKHRALYSILQDKSLKWNTFYEKEHLQRFINLMGHPERNPFIGRSVWLEFQEEAENEDENFRENSTFWPTAFQFLSTYGCHIWYFTIGTYGAKNTYARFLYLLKTCATLMPNLRSLHIFGWINESEEDTERTLSMEQIPAYLESNPIPILPFLETLELDNMSGLPPSVQDHLISRHSEQIKCLQISEWDDSSSVTKMKLPVLQELIVDVSRYRPMEKTASLLSQLADSPLGKLHISFSSLESKLDMENLFELIDQFGSTLRSLRLTVIPGVARGKEKLNKSCSCDLTKSQLQLITPQLQALHLEGFDRLSLEFLKTLSPSLKYLELRPLSASCRKSCYPDETIDLYQYLHCNQVYDSRIWVDLPKLNRIYFEICNPNVRRFVDLIYSRETYEYLEGLKNVTSK